MLPLIVIFLLMAGLLSAGWQWPRLIFGGDDPALALWLRASWLACIAAPSLALIWLVLRRPGYLIFAIAWLAFGLVSVAELPAFRATELVGQVALLALWIEAAVRAASWCPRVLAGAAAAVHVWMGVWGAVAKVADPGWMPDSPEVLMRVYGAGAAGAYALPFVAVMALCWMLGRVR